MGKVEKGVGPLGPDQLSADDDPRIARVSQWVLETVRHFAERYVQPADAEDMAMDIVDRVLVVIPTKPAYLTDQKLLAGDVYTAAKYAIINFYKARQLHDTGNLKYVNAHAGRIREGENPDLEYDLNATIEALMESAGKLGQRCGEVLEARLIEGQSHAEIAARMGIGTSAVSQQVIRGEEHLWEAVESTLVELGFRKKRRTKSPPTTGRGGKQ